jgi:hypothetical protein
MHGVVPSWLGNQEPDHESHPENGYGAHDGVGAVESLPELRRSWEGHSGGDSLWTMWALR